MNNILKRIMSLLLAVLMVLEVFSPVAVSARALLDEEENHTSIMSEPRVDSKSILGPETKPKKEPLDDELFSVPAKKAEPNKETNKLQEAPARQKESSILIESPAKEETAPQKELDNTIIEAGRQREQKAEDKLNQAVERAKQAEQNAKASENLNLETSEIEKPGYKAWRVVNRIKAIYKDGKLDCQGLLIEVEDFKGNKKTLTYDDILKDENIIVNKEIKEGIFGSSELIITTPGLRDIKIDVKVENIKKDKKEKSDLSLEKDNSNKLEDKENAEEKEGLLDKIKNFFADDEQTKGLEEDAGREDAKLEFSDLDGINKVNELTEEELEAGLTLYQMPTVSGKSEEESGFGFFRSAFRAVGAGNQGDLNLDGKKFTIITRFDTSTAVGPIKAGQYFTIHLDEKLIVNNPSNLEPIKYKGQVIALPEYDTETNSIKYKILNDINENISVPLNIPVDYNPGKITEFNDDGTFTVINKVTGIGVNNPPKDLVPQKVDKNGNPAGSIIEPGRKDVTQIVDSSRNYRLDIDSVGNPVIKNGEMVGINWVVKIDSDKDLKNDLGMKMNFTLVEGSGLEKIESITSSDSTEVIQDNAIKGNTGIVDSKHSTINQSIKSYMYTIYTPVSNWQAAYVLDISTVLTKDLTNGQPYVGAVRSVMDKGYPKDKVEQHTPTRVGINNRTTIEGKFLSNTNAQWTITDGVCTLDKNNGLPLETRTLEGENINSGKRVVYGVDTATGKMVVKEEEKGLTDIPAKEADPNTSQAVGNIGVYQFTHDVDESTTPHSYKISGVKISKFQDLYIDQEWNLPVKGMTMPGQKFIAKDDAGTQIAEKHVDAGPAGENQRLVVVPDARYWNIVDDKTANKVGHNITQEFDNPTVTGPDGKTYKYNENANYYQINTNSQYIHNSAIDTTQAKPVTFTVVKVDSKDPSKKLAGARFKLLGDNQLSIVTDDQGKATFNNVLPGTYTLIEEKAPAGYKLDQAQKTITIAEDGTISVNGSNIQSGGTTNKTKLVQHDRAPNWPDYMNAMHYGKITTNETTNQNEVEFYLYLKPESNNGGNGTNRDTRLNISIPGVNITDVTAYDVSPGYRQTVKYSMEQQNIDGYIPLLGDTVINAANNNKITGTPNKTDPYTGKTGYQIYFPEARFANDWGFLVKVKANIGDKQSVNLDYDWLTDKDTAEQTKLTQNVIINKANGEAGENQLIVTNEEFTKSPISVTKFGDEFDKDGNRNRLQGAEFVLKDSKDNVIAQKFTDENGTADFGQFPEGVYRLEETQAPNGYQKSDVYFEVVVDEKGQVKYNPRFEDGFGTPEAGRDYYIEKGEETGDSNKATVTNVNQRLEYLENEPGDIGVITGVWEAYKFESLKYHADITLSNSAPGTRFEIQFDRNLDFTQYFSDFPKIVIGGEEVADPYFDYNTNLLTYVFNDKSKGGSATASINLRGIIPDKYYAKESKTYPFTIKVAPGVANVGGNPVLHKDINADYGPYDSGSSNSNQFYYFRDVYQKEDGEWYVTVMAYLNPMGFSYGSKTTQFNWITTDFQSDQQIARWSGKGYEPLYKLQDVKVYGTDFASYRENGVWKNPYMPPSFGVRPEQEPNIYNLLAHQRINPDQKLYIRENDVTINYDPNEIKKSESGRIDKSHPLKVTTPSPRDNGGYIIEQTYKITDIDQFNKKWRAFHMTDGNLESAFASKANVNTAIGDQAGGEIPKYYKEIVGLINNKYKPGSFKLTKYDEANQKNKLQNATFALKDENGKVIYRTSNDKGEVDFTNIAPGRYSLEETKAPDGYRLTNKKWQVTVLSDGSVRIRETSITGESKLYTNATVPINIPVANKPTGQKFRVYKKDGKGQPLQGAKFKISDPDNTDSNFPIYATSNQNGIVEFNGNPQENKNYILEEVEPPKGYNPLNKKWVLRVEDGKVKVYNYSESTGGQEVEKSLLGEDGTEWVDVKGRNTSGWSNYDNRWTGWVANSQDAEHLGTRIIAINKEKKYVVQRYIINPEARQTVGVDGITAATIHREKPEYPNMDWYKGDEEIKIFTLEPKTGGNTDGKVSGLISDLRLASYTVTDITKQVTKTPDNSHHGETRVKLDLPATDKPIVVDVKVPYKDENGGVGTGMDWREGNTTYWKSDYYERVSDIKTAGLVSETGGTIVGSYVAEGSLDVTNDIKTYGFKIKKVKDGETNTVIPGASFKLTGTDGSKKEMTTGSDGMISFDGLKPGTYKLEEEKPAPGYEKSNTTWTVRVSDDGKVYIKKNEEASNEANALAMESNAKLTIVQAIPGDTSNVNTELAMKMQSVKASTYNFTNESVGNSPLFLNEADKRENSVIKKINAIYGENNFEKLFPNGITIREVAMASYDENPVEEVATEATEATEATVVSEDGLEIGPETSPEAQKAGAEFTIDSSPTTKTYGGTAVTTTVKDLGNGKFEVKIELKNTSEKYGPDDGCNFGFEFNDNFTFVSGSTLTWNGVIGNAPTTRWHYGYNQNTNKIDFYPKQPKINKKQTFGLKFEVQAKDNLPAGQYELISNIIYKHDSRADQQNIDSPTVTKKGPTITYQEKEVRTEIPIPAEATRIPNDQMYEGEENEKFAGKAGYKIDIYKYKYIDGVEQPNPEFVRNKETVNAEPKIIEYGTKKKGPEQRTSNPVTITEEIPFEIQETVDDSLQPGEVVVDTQGKNGSVQYKYSITYEKSEGESAERPADWPKDAPTAQPQAGERVISYNKVEVEGTRENPTTQIQRKGPGGAQEGETEIKPGETAQITNKQVGLDLKIYKKDRYDRKLEGAIFTIRKTDENYENPDTDFGVVRGTSNKEGLVEFKDKNGNIVNLPVGYYLIEEEAAPLGYRKPNAPWKVQVVEENGQLVAKYKGPEETPQSFAEKNENLDIKEANGVKYATKITHIDTESRTFIQRVYIDTRGKNGVVNVQITPKHKREEIDRAGLPPVTIKEGVKTAYRSTYKISGINGDPDQAQMIKILNDYDVSYPDVTVVNTARWRPFDWGFDEDQLNLEPGVYYIDIEGFYDTSIIDRNVTNEVAIDSNYNFTQKDGVTLSAEPVLKDPYVNNDKNDLPDADLGKIDIDIKFYDGAREFQQLKNSNGKIVYGFVKDENGKDKASYQDGVETLRQWLEDNYGKDYANNWFKTKLSGQKYVNQLSKIVKIGKNDIYNAGRIVPPIEGATPSSTIKTSMDISSLYSSNATNTVPQEGLSIENDAERYNITFSKHGKLTDTDSIEEITKRRLEGAVFKLEKRVREGIYEELEGSYVSSAFNGYFGFRGLEPGRYRLVEVQAPKGYKPINGPLLYFSVETVSIVSQLITDPRTGENIDVKTVEFYFPGNTKAYKFEDLEMHDPVTNEVIKFKNAKNADLETTKIIDPTDSTQETEVSLRDLSIKFPGEIKDKEGKVIKDTYKISEIQITPTSNGYISLEYDKANGVYQYIKESSTTEQNGLLVDYVTSATAKNMGKIVNEKPGKGEITIRKIDQKGNEIKGTNQLPGAKFRITNMETGKTEDGTVGKDGTLKFTGLNIGHYRLEEIESPDGYINNKQVWNFTVGGEDLDPYAKDAPIKRNDVSSSITLSESQLSVLNPNSKNKGLLSDNQGEMHPHFGEVFEFANKYTIDSNLKINPGDYFVLKLSDNIDLHGIMETDISNLDIIADGVGTIAKAEYNRKEGTITYTFTNYADTYSLVEFSNKLKAYINLNKVPKAGDQTIGRGVVGHDMIEDNINVVYDSMTARELYQATDGNWYERTQNHLNLGSKIIKFNPDTGEFVHYYYVNRDRSNTPRSRFYYSSDQNIENLNIDYYYLDSNANLDELMPLSFGVNEDDPRLPEPVRIRSRASLDAGQEESIGFTNGLNSNSSYILKVTGKVVGEDKDGYVGHGMLEMTDNPARYVTRWDKQYFFRNEATAKANLIIQAVNPENKIKFKKIDQDGNPLEGATFQLFKKNNDGNWDGHGQPITTGKDGIIEYSKLPKGEYQLKETSAPDGYEKLEGAILEFEVDASGNIHRSKGTNDTTDTNNQPVYVDESGSIAIPIVNKKPQKIKFEKVDASDKTTKLEGAEFEVWYKDNETDEKYTTQLKVYKKTVDGKTERLVLKEDDNIPTGYTPVEGDKFVTGKDGLVEFNVLNNGYYALKEVKAPKGYIKPRDIVKEFVVKDGKVQTEQYKTEMDVNKTTGLSMANDVFQKSYTTNMTLRFNPNHEDITYVKDNSKITLSNLPLKSEIWDNKYNAKQPLSITAYLVDGDNKKSTNKTYTLDLTNDYGSGTKASTTIDLYSLVKELENQSTDGDIKSNKTIVLAMTSSLYLDSKLDIKSNIVIGDKISEDRTFHIETKGDEYVDHSYNFTTSGEPTLPIPVENRKGEYPWTGGMGTLIFTVSGLILMSAAAYVYSRKRRASYDE
ncbi:SpaA isopeptide-forming pilin-related protein [Peptoniphilus grossensis]|uniref:SpaA isopeptide-forming pilin-related protein n=1 Tax=Peptoniphilus grossensis TaxID=1465756 RepID=UPI0039924776